MEPEFLLLGLAYVKAQKLGFQHLSVYLQGFQTETILRCRSENKANSGVSCNAPLYFGDCTIISLHASRDSHLVRVAIIQTEFQAKTSITSWSLEWSRKLDNERL